MGNGSAQGACDPCVQHLLLLAELQLILQQLELVKHKLLQTRQTVLQIAQKRIVPGSSGQSVCLTMRTSAGYSACSHGCIGRANDCMMAVLEAQLADNGKTRQKAAEPQEG